MSNIVRIWENGANTAGDIELMDTQLMAVCGAEDSSDDSPILIHDENPEDGSGRFELCKSEKQLFFSEEKSEKVKSGF